MSVNIVNKSTGALTKIAGNPVEQASGISYDHTSSGMQANNVQAAVDELKSGLTNLDNEVNGDATTYPYADVITIEDAVPANLADCSVKVEPVQDLHGYDKPWVGGAGLNECSVDTSSFSGSINGWYSLSGASATTVTDGTKVSLLAGKHTIKLYDASNISLLQVLNSASHYYINNVSGGTFTLESDMDVYIRIKVESTGAVACKTILERGETAHDWQPYTNICPITGHTEASVQRDGVNLFDKDNDGNLTGRALNPETGVPYVSSGWMTSSFIKIEPSTTYTLTTTSNSSAVAFYDSEKVYISGATTFGTKTTPSNANYLRFDYKTENAGIMQLELGSTATPYVPYAGKTYTLALGDTIYGGTVDFDSGVMTVDRTIVDIGTLNWEYNAGTNAMSTELADVNLPTSDAVPVNAISSICRTISADDRTITAGIKMYVFANINVIYIRDSGYTDAIAFKNAMVGQQICYELATPTTIQLTPQQIQLLKGTNTLTASTGDISVTVNGVSGAIGKVQEQVNDHEERIEVVESGLTNLVKVATAEITTNAYGWLYFPQNRVVLGAYVGDYKNIPLFYDSGNNRYYSRLYLDATATPLSYASFDNNTAYTVTYVYIDNE